MNSAEGTSHLSLQDFDFIHVFHSIDDTMVTLASSCWNTLTLQTPATTKQGKGSLNKIIWHQWLYKQIIYCWFFIKTLSFRMFKGQIFWLREGQHLEEEGNNQPCIWGKRLDLGWLNDKPYSANKKSKIKIYLVDLTNQ